MKKLFLFALTLTVLFSCSRTSNTDTNMDGDETGEFVEFDNPPAEGFNLEGSDMLATLIADKVMVAMGGRKAWDNSRYLKWNFFGRRSHVWDKTSGDVRIEDPSKELIILMNINTMEGKVRIGEQELTAADSLSEYLERGKKMWINDSYWLVMPYKLKDTGVTLYYLGESTTETGIKSDLIKLTFEDVGVTPENFYDVWVDIDTKLIVQWAYYPSMEYSEPSFITPWTNYKKYGDILLSGDRGGNRQLTDIDVLEDVPEGTFTTFDLTPE